MTVTVGSRSRGGIPRATTQDRRYSLRRVAAGIAIGLGCTTTAAAIIGAGMYLGSGRDAQAMVAAEIAAQEADNTAQSIVEKNALAFTARFPLPDTHFAASRADDPNANPTLAFAIPASAQLPPRNVARNAPPKLVSVAAYDARNADARDAKPTQAGIRLASLGPLDGPLMPQDDINTPRTAVYDITAQALYMPNGEKLEAHSGFGSFMDSPRHVHLKMRGATPPNSYKLTMREAKFHGVEAVRMNPEDEDAMMGRAGILVHPYMLGPTGQSNGCISLKEYGKFLDAFKRGEVDRVVVVTKLDTPPAAYARAHPIASKWTAWIQKIF